MKKISGMGTSLSKRKRMSPALKRFCERVALDPRHDVAKAYTYAGYTKGNPLIQGEALLARPDVAAKIKEIARESIHSVEFVQNMQNRAMCLDLWRGIIRNNEYEGQEVPLELKLRASALLSKACGLMVEKSSETRQAVMNVNVGPSQPVIQVNDPYAVPVGDGQTVDIVPLPGGFGGGGKNAD